MAAAVASSPAELPGPGRRRSFFKPSTWSTMTKASSPESSRRSSKDLDASSGSVTPPSTMPSSPTLSARLLAKPDAEGRISFFHRGQDNFWLSNSSDDAIFSDDVRYATAEHLFQASKFLPEHPEIAAKIRKASNPLDAIKMARKYSKEVKSGWIREGVNVQTMRDVLLLKFTQHSELRLALLETGDAELVDASPTDAFWGAAGNGRGRNELGKALMTVRETIRSASGLGYGSGAKTV